MIFLPTIKNKTIIGKTLWWDFISLENVTLRGCRLIYFGLGSVQMSGKIRIEDCQFKFVGPAGAGRQMSKDLAKHGMTDGD